VISNEVSDPAMVSPASKAGGRNCDRFSRDPHGDPPPGSHIVGYDW